jgi:hypothetical protein
MSWSYFVEGSEFQLDLCRLIYFMIAMVVTRLVGCFSGSSHIIHILRMTSVIRSTGRDRRLEWMLY